VSSPLKVLIISILDIFAGTANGLLTRPIPCFGGNFQPVFFEVRAGAKGGEKLEHA
jgi:hypothetical protein